MITMLTFRNVPRWQIEQDAKVVLTWMFWFSSRKYSKESWFLQSCLRLSCISFANEKRATFRVSNFVECALFRDWCNRCFSKDIVTLMVAFNCVYIQQGSHLLNSCSALCGLKAFLWNTFMILLPSLLLVSLLYHCCSHVIFNRYL